MIKGRASTCHLWKVREGFALGANSTAINGIELPSHAYAVLCCFVHKEELPAQAGQFKERLTSYTAPSSTTILFIYLRSYDPCSWRSILMHCAPRRADPSPGAGNRWLILPHQSSGPADLTP